MASARVNALAKFLWFAKRPSPARVEPVLSFRLMGHKYQIGQDVHYRPSIRFSAAPGIYTITKTLPVERDARLAYRIKSAAETFERTADESELTLP